MARQSNLIYRHTIVTRVTHWIWAASLFFLMLTGLQIFNAHPALYVGEQSGFEFDNAILKFGAPPIPGWATIPSGQDLATGRVIHFFFAWIFLGTVMIWAIGAILSGHFFRDLLPRLKDFRSLTKDIVDHLGFRFNHGKQRLADTGKAIRRLFLTASFPEELEAAIRQAYRDLS
ncbi:MAG: hypothetical protein AAFY31_17975, partial [Pseudomonadota bacterium]